MMDGIGLIVLVCTDLDRTRGALNAKDSHDRREPHT